MSGAVQAPALAGVVSVAKIHKVDGAENCTPVIGTVDALSVGLSLRTLARTKLTGETAAAYERVAGQLIAAARLALAGGK